MIISELKLKKERKNLYLCKIASPQKTSKTPHLTAATDIKTAM